jgi:hypothetical protein
MIEEIHGGISAKRQFRKYDDFSSLFLRLCCELDDFFRIALEIGDFYIDLANGDSHAYLPNIRFLLTPHMAKDRLNIPWMKPF